MFGFDAAFAIDLFDAHIPELLADQPALYFTLGIDRDWDSRVVAALNRVRSLARTGVRAPTAIMDVHAVLDEMRLFKDSDEIATMRSAADISAGRAPPCHAGGPRRQQRVRNRGGAAA